MKHHLVPLPRPDILELEAEGLYEQPIYPGNGYPPNVGEDRPGLSPFGRLAKKQGLGKSTVLLYNASGNTVQPAGQEMIRVEGDDLDATQMIVTLAAPQVIALPPNILPIDVESSPSGGQSNSEVTTDNFPGAVLPIAWPPLEAVIEWGVKGASAKAVIDFVNGVTFAVVASFLSVRAQVSQTLASADIGATSAAYLLQAFVGPGLAPTRNPQRTIYTGVVVNNTESDVFDIPRFAKRAYLVGCDPQAAPALTAGFIRFWQSPDGTNCVGNVFCNANQPTPFDVPNAAQYFSVQNGSGADMKMSVVFELGL